LTDQRAYTVPEATAWFYRGGAAQFRLILLGEVPIGDCRVSDGESPAEKWIGMDIHPDYRGQGLCRPAYGLLLSALRESGVSRFRLRVLASNWRARHIYDVLGFEVVLAGDDAPAGEVEMVLR
jgi:RimJ/RimL family protein N-acetyltransferase